jgi:hypothetical protein
MCRINWFDALGGERERERKRDGLTCNECFMEEMRLGFLAFSFEASDFDRGRKASENAVARWLFLAISGDLTTSSPQTPLPCHRQNQTSS